MPQFQIFFLLLLIFRSFIQLQSVHLKSTNNNNNNNCPHLLKTLSNCTCVRSNTIDCSYSTTLIHLPRSWISTNHNLTIFTQSITRFNLSSLPSFTFIKTNDFQGLTNLRHLLIINTGLITIQPHAFRHLYHLYELRIELNQKLTEIKTFALSDIEHIHLLSLKSNSIRILHTESFRNTHFVDILDLSDNPLEIIESYAFNGLKSVGTLILCLSSTCSIKQIDPYAFFGFHTCDRILLTGLHLSLHSNSFSYMTSIRLVNLSHSDISHIHNYAFQTSEHIGEIDLSSSLISAIDVHAFDQLVNVSLLNLQGNLIRLFEKSIFQSLIYSIKQINLDNNPIQCDCTLEWYLEQRSNQFKLPDVCTGPIGYECLSPTELHKSQLPCYQTTNQTKKRNLCERREKDISVRESSAYLYELNCNLFILIIFIFTNKILFLL